MLYPQSNKSRAIIDLNGLWKFRILKKESDFTPGMILEDDFDWIAVPASYNDQKEEWRDIQCGYICYKEGEEKYPAYCIMPNTNGVDEEGSYTVTINKLVNNKLIYNPVKDGD